MVDPSGCAEPLKVLPTITINHLAGWVAFYFIKGKKIAIFRSAKKWCTQLSQAVAGPLPSLQEAVSRKEELAGLRVEGQPQATWT